MTRTLRWLATTVAAILAASVLVASPAWAATYSAPLRTAVASEGPARTEEEMGDLLFSITNLARKLGIDSESALRKANEKFTKRFTELEERLHAKGRSVHEASLEEMETEWTLVKQTPHTP